VVFGLIFIFEFFDKLRQSFFHGKVFILELLVFELQDGVFFKSLPIRSVDLMEFHDCFLEVFI
jgi:hypothetical protein